jgi:ribosomal protein S18 acetylase RimI-like enzyme
MTHTRIGKKEDIERISWILASSWKTAYRGIVHDEWLNALKYDSWTGFLTTGLNNDSVFSLVLENSQEIIGAAILGKTEQERTANLISFYLLPDKIGQGLGHAFYNGIETELRNRGFLNCVVDVLENNARAIRFYKTHGFVDTGKIIAAVLGERNYACMVLEKVL